MNDTLDTVAQLEARLFDLRAEQELTRTRIADLQTEVHHVIVEGGADADHLLKQQTEVQAKSVALAGAIATVEKQFAEAQALAWPVEASKRMLGLHKIFNSFYVKYEEDIACLQKDATAYVERLEKVNGDYHRLEDVLCEALVLNDQFGTPIPASLLECYIGPNAVGVVADAVHRVKNVKPADAAPLPTELYQLPYRSTYGTSWTADRVLRRIQGTPTAELLDRAGAPELSDRTAYEARRERLLTQARVDADAARLEELRAYDEWVTDALHEQRPEQAVWKKADEAGLRLLRDKNHVGASIKESVLRLGIAGFTKDDDKSGQVWWILPGQSTEGFTPLPSNAGPPGWRS
jgi:hypothetical protein